MKKRLCLFLSLLTLAFCLPAFAESADWNYDANYAILRGYDGAGGDVVVPAEIDGFTVDVIGVSVFKGDTITSLTLRRQCLSFAATPSPRAKIWPALRCPRAWVINRAVSSSCAR